MLKDPLDAVTEMREEGGGDTVASIVEEFNAKYCVVNDNGKFVIFRKRHDPFLERTFYERFTSQDFKNLHANRYVTTAGDGEKPGTRRAVDVWLGHPKRRQYLGGVVFDPTCKHVEDDQLNLWESFAVKPEPGNWTRMKRHLKHVLCNGDPDCFRYVVGWSARAVQSPEKMGEVALVMKGGEGTGKGVFGKAMVRIFGQHGLAISNSRHLTGNFNAHLRDCVLLFADEAFFPGDKAHVGTLKSVITEPHLTIEGKGQNVVQTPNFLHVMMASNEDWVVPASLDSRRFFVLDVSKEKKDDTNYFDALWGELRDGGLAAMLYDLLNVRLGSFNVRRFPVTDALRGQRLRTIDTLHQWWLDVLERGHVWESRLGMEHVFSRWYSSVTTDLLYASYGRFAEAKRERHIASRQALGSFMQNVAGAEKRRWGQGEVGVVKERDRLSAEGTTWASAVVTQQRPWGYDLKTLKEARIAFNEKTGLGVKFDESDDDKNGGPKELPDWGKPEDTHPSIEDYDWRGEHSPHHPSHKRCAH